MNTHDSRSTTKLTGARPPAAEATHAQSPDQAEAVPAFPLTGQPVQQARLLALQRIAGNAAVARMVQRSQGTRIQRDTPPGATTPMQRARAALDAMSQDRVGEAAAMISGAAARAGQASSLITLTLPGNVTIDQFPTDQLPRLLEYANTIAMRAPADPASERMFRRVQQAQDQANERRIANERLNQFLRDAQNPQRGTGQNANTFLVHDRNGQLQQLTQEQLTQWRDRLTAEINRIISQANTHVNVTNDVREHFSGTINGMANPTSFEAGLDLQAVSRQMDAAGQYLARGRFVGAYLFAAEARRQAESVHTGRVQGMQDTSVAQEALWWARFVRDTSAALFGTLVTVATGGGAGAVLLGAATGAALTAGAEIQDQYSEGDRVNWNSVLWNAVFNTVGGFIGGRSGGALTTAVVHEMEKELVRMGVAVTGRAQRIVLERAVPLVVNGVMARVSAAGASGLSGRMQNTTVRNFTPANPQQQATSQYQHLTQEQIDTLASDQVNIRNSVVEVLNQSGGQLGELLRTAAQAAARGGH
ncbi:MAG: hypothetical protein KME04_15775 [Pleurocapsa minor GSE-CHR-MK-17-07R]|jgi:hypothetical protein|nr:hypothetical protein [Pleurocapsa minor GSE-CHR-MK 17-07R]